MLPVPTVEFTLSLPPWSLGQKLECSVGVKSKEAKSTTRGPHDVDEMGVCKPVPMAESEGATTKLGVGDQCKEELHKVVLQWTLRLEMDPKGDGCCCSRSLVHLMSDPPSHCLSATGTGATGGPHRLRAVLGHVDSSPWVGGAATPRGTTWQCLV